MHYPNVLSKQNEYVHASRMELFDVCVFLLTMSNLLSVFIA